MGDFDWVTRVETSGGCQRARQYGTALDCQHGGTLRSLPATFNSNTNIFKLASCAECDCPDPEEWGGLDCSACRSNASCGAKTDPASGVEEQPIMCDTSPLPHPVELLPGRGKIFTCVCGGTAVSDAMCSLAGSGKYTAIMNVTRASTEEPKDHQMQLKTWSGVMDPGPNFPNVEKYKYAQPGRFDGLWNTCVLKNLACPPNDKFVGAPFGNNGEKKCLKIECAGSNYVKCPPDGVEVCPTWDGEKCDVEDPYWQFFCSPILTPKAEPVDLWCEIEESADDDGSFLCYFFQEVMLTGITFTCTTGDCIYPSDCANMPYLANGTRAQCLNENGFEVEEDTSARGDKSEPVVNGTIVGLVTAVEWLRRNGWKAIASELEESAGVAGFNKFTDEPERLIIIQVNSRLSRAQVAGICVGALLFVAFVVLVAALLLYRQWKNRKQGDLKRTRERLQLALLESIPPSKCLGGGDMCFVSTDIESSTVLRVHALAAYDK